jgi:hypothetical protein
MRARVSLTLALMLVAGGTALAGFKTNIPVVIDLELRNAQGALGTARNTTDALQYIGCTITTDDGWSLTECVARDAAGVTVSCINGVNTGMRDAALSINGDSFIYFQWDAIGQCTQLVVRNNSWHAPKK